MIELQDVHKTYDTGTKALNGISMKIDDGEFVFLVGPSGSGKSTIIKILTAELRPTSGSALVNGFAVEKLRALQAVIRQQKLLNGAASQNPNVFLRLCAANQLGACPESVSAVDQCDAAAGVCQKQRVLQRRIAAAHDRDVQTLIKRAVADCAIRYAAAGQRTFRRKPQ